MLIPLTKGQFAKVDPADFHELSTHGWRARNNTAGGFYAVKNGVNGSLMHRVILGRKLGRALMPHENTDHRNGDTLDNRRSNLRLASDGQNSCNRTGHRGSSSRYKGVSWHRASGKWEARIFADGERKHLGYFHDEGLAAKAYDGAAKVLHGRFARLNFPPPGKTAC